MSTPNVLVLRAPGTNCDEETAFAFERAGASSERVHINRLLEKPELAAGFQILCIPGGFSYGDDVAAGRILGGQIQHHLVDTLREFHAADKLILGICNGFQVLLKSGILLPGDEQGPPATLAWNDSQRYEDRWVRLAADSSRCVFLSGIEEIELPIAHAEGRFVARDEGEFSKLSESGQLALRYRAKTTQGAAESIDIADDADNANIPYPDNPNGSQGNVAGVCDATGRIFGLMPHPERYLEGTNHPQWTRQQGTGRQGTGRQGTGRPAREAGEGLRVFQNAVRYFQ